jgi:CheY-like chemotaxis protein
MNPRPSVAVVEDNPPQRMILCKLLANDYDVSDFASGEDFLASPLCFDGVLMDIEMPGRNGYDTCRALRGRAENNDMPVIFVSAHDTAPERVAAYEAGGEDFVTKPITAHELRHKLHAAIEHRHQLRALAETSNAAQKIAFTAMISMGDLGVVIEFLRKTTLCKDYSSLAQELMAAMSAWNLRGAIQIRGQNGSIHLASAGRMSPLQQSVLDTMRDMGRIFEMGSRAIINYERVSLLVENLPTEDPDKVGRLRDHLAVLAESTDMRISGMDAIQERDLQKVGIDGALVELRTTLGRVAEHNHSNRKIGQFHVLEALEHLARAVGTLGLTEAQLNYVDDLVKCTIDDTHHYFDEAAGVETEFAEVLARLERLSMSDYRF